MPISARRQPGQPPPEMPEEREQPVIHGLHRGAGNHAGFGAPTPHNVRNLTLRADDLEKGATAFGDL